MSKPFADRRRCRPRSGGRARGVCRPAGRDRPGAAARWGARGLRGRPGLDVPLDVFLVRKLGAPGHEELAMGAIASGGVVVVNDEVRPARSRSLPTN